MSRLAAPTTSSTLRFLLSPKTGSTGRPRIPPMALTSSHAISRPRLASAPDGAPGPVSGVMPPIMIGDPWAFAPSLTSASVAAPATMVPAPASAAPFKKFRRLSLTEFFTKRDLISMCFASPLSSVLIASASASTIFSNNMVRRRRKRPLSPPLSARASLGRARILAGRNGTPWRAAFASAICWRPTSRSPALRAGHTNDRNVSQPVARPAPPAHRGRSWSVHSCERPRPS